MPKYLVMDKMGKGHLPVDTRARMGAAWAALHNGFRGQKYDGPDKDAAIAKLTAMYKSMGLQIPNTADEPGVDSMHVNRLRGAIRVPKQNGGMMVPPPSARFLVKMYANIKRKMGAKGFITQSEFSQEFRTARAHAGGVERAARRLGANTAAEDMPDEPDTGTDEDDGDDPTGAMIAFMLDPDVAAALAQPGGEEAGDLHVTLCYLGDASDLDPLAQAHILIAAERCAADFPPLEGTISGVGRFTPDTTGDPYVVYASVDVPGLEDLQDDLSDSLDGAGCTYSDDHGFTPHVTLAYVPDDTGSLPSIPSLPLCIDAITVCFAGVRTVLPLAGTSQPSMFAHLTAETTRVVVEMAEPVRPDQQWIQFVPPPGTYQHPEWGAVTITRSTNEEMVRNHTNGEYQDRLPVDLEHKTQLSGAAGWVHDLRLRGDGAIEANVVWTRRGKTLLAEDAYRYLSPAWYPSWTQPDSGKTFANVLIGGGLTNRPFFKPRVLDALAASEQEIQMPDPIVESTSAATTAADVSVTASESVSPLAFAEMQRTMAEQKTALTALLAANEKQGADLKTAAEQLGKMRSAELRGRLIAEVTGRGNANGVRWFGETEANVTLLESMINSFGEDSETVTKYIETQRAAAAQLEKGSLFAEFGRAGAITSDQTGTAGIVGRVDASARAFAEKNPGMSKEKAILAVLESDPVLYAEYRSAKKAEKSRSGI